MRAIAAFSTASMVRQLSQEHGDQLRTPGLALTLAEREVISRGVTAHQSVRSIAKLLGRSPSTVSREMGRNGS